MTNIENTCYHSQFVTVFPQVASFLFMPKQNARKMALALCPTTLLKVLKTIFLRLEMSPLGLFFKCKYALNKYIRVNFFCNTRLPKKYCTSLCIKCLQSWSFEKYFATWPTCTARRWPGFDTWALELSLKFDQM